jgi:Flp pilus assembly protein TadD
VIVGCAGVLPAPRYSGEVDAYAALIESSEVPPAPDEDVLALPPEADALLAQTLEGEPTPQQRVRALAHLFERDGALGLRYELLTTGTAAETFERRAGSCLAFTHLFVALARRAGIDARYREVVTVPQWERAGDYVVVNRHVIAYGEIPRFGTYTVDFGVLSPEERRFGRGIDDARARAQHFNNRGASALADGDGVAAVAYFNRALRIDPSLAYVWSNLGTAYLRLDDRTRAEIALRHAQSLSPYDVTPLNQLARLYQLQGEDALAREYLERAGSARLRNPYVLFQEGIAARNDGELERAIDLLRRAVRTQPDEVQFLIELGATYGLSGRYDRARHAFVRAGGLVVTEEERRALRDAISLGAGGADKQS